MGKRKITRAEADRLFEGLKRTGPTSANRPVNPFEEGMFEVIDRPEEETSIWRNEVVVLPAEIELPPGYKTVAEVREAMTRNWGVAWLSEDRHGVTARLADGWGVDRPDTGGGKVYAGTFARAEWSAGDSARLRLLCRYRVESRFDPSDDRCQLVVRDGEVDWKPLEFSAYAPESGPRHPEWKKWQAWLDEKYPGHRDPFKYWSD